MLAKKFRFHGHGSLRYVYRNGQAVRGRVFTVKYTKNPTRTQSRYAVVISKKIHKSAVSRNRVRRRIYEILRAYNDKHMHVPHDVVVIISHPDALHMPAVDLQNMLVNALEKIQ